MRPRPLSANIYKNLKFLNKISKPRTIQFIRRLLREASAPQLLVLIEIAANIRKGNFHYTTRQKRALIRHDSHIRRLSECKSFQSIFNILSDHPSLLKPLIHPIVRRAK